MENKNKKIVFLIPDENASATQIISNILEKNGIHDINNDLMKNEDDSKWVTVISATKDLFSRKTSEDQMSTLFQDKLKVTREIANQIISDLKKDIIPYCKEINTVVEKQKSESPNFLNSDETKIALPTDVEKNIAERSSVAEVEPVNQIDSPAKKIQRIKKIPTVVKDIPKQSSGPDVYREPIE